MKKIIYRLNRYFFSSKPVFSIIAIICFIASMYSVKPMDVNSGFVVSGVFQFCLMIFVTQSINGSEINDEEHILYLREKSSLHYLTIREISMVIISGVYGLLISLGPVYVNCVNHFDFFLRKLTVYDVVMAFIMILGSGLVGIAIGDILNPRIIKERKIALALTVLIMTLAIVKEGIKSKFANMFILDIILPPVMEPAKQFAKCEVFDSRIVAKIFVCMLFYYLVITGVKIALMNKRKFD